MKRARFCGLSYVVIAIALLSLGTAQASVIIIDDSATTGITYSGVWNLSSSIYTKPMISSNYHYHDATVAGSATYKPGSVAGFTAGTYEVYSAWEVHDTNSKNLTYTVNYNGGSEAFSSIDSTKYASQGVNGCWNTTTPFTSSGYRYLGTFDLDNASNVVLTGTAAGSNKYIGADALMFRDVSDKSYHYIDPFSSDVTASRQATSYSYFQLGLDTKDVAWWTTGAPLKVSYDPKIPVSNSSEVSVSWGASNNGVTALCYVDANGNGALDSGEFSKLIDTSKRADGAAPTAGWEWSGYYVLDGSQMNPSSKIVWEWNGVAQGAKTNLHLSAATVPEPGTLVLLAAGLMGLIAYAWRKRK